jgi:hypothetical protein
MDRRNWLGNIACALLVACAVGSEAPLSAGTDRRPAPLTEQQKLEILRFLDGEFARVVRPLPSVKPGFYLRAGGGFDEHALEQALMRSLPAANPGDTVQITGIAFRAKEIRIYINGGSEPRKSLRERVHVQIGMPWPHGQVVRDEPTGLVRMGSTLILDFDGPVPSLTAEDVKKLLAPFLDFSHQRSAAVNWVDTLPPEFRQAIRDHRAVVGMNHDMVEAALGRPERKVRQRQPDGTETEDWIYGSPPGKTIFVTFVGDRVVRVRQYL